MADGETQTQMHLSRHKGEYNIATKDIKAAFREEKTPMLLQSVPKTEENLMMSWHQTTQNKQETQLLASSSYRMAEGHPSLPLYLSKYLSGSISQILEKKMNPSLLLCSGCPKAQTPRGTALFSVESVVLKSVRICRAARTQPHAPVWSIRLILYSCLSAECWVFFPPSKLITLEKLRVKYSAKHTFLTIFVNELQIVLWFGILCPTVSIHFEII